MRTRWMVCVTLLALGCGPASEPPQAPSPSPAHAAPKVLPPSPAPPPAAPQERTTVEQPKLAPCATHQEPSAVPFLKGEVHVHTERSFDAATPIPEVIAFYAERGYDFLSITDHNHITLPKSHPSGILLIPGVELTYNATACEPPPRPGYLCAFHANVLFLNPMRDTTRGRHFGLPFRKNRLEVFRMLMKRADDLEGIFVLNHPTYQYAVDEELLDELLDRGVRFVEFFNGGVIDRNKDGPRAEIERDEQLWDAMLERGHPVWATGGDDAHHFSDAATIRMTGRRPLLGDRAWIMVRAERKLEAIRRAMEDGDFYVSTGVELANVLLSQESLHITVRVKEGESYVTRFIGNGGYILARVEGSEACYPITGSEGYVRAVVESSAGKLAWTQAVMLDRTTPKNAASAQEMPAPPQQDSLSDGG